MVNLLHLEKKEKTLDTMKPVIRLLKNLDFLKESSNAFTDQELHSLSKSVTTKMFKKGAKILTADQKDNCDLYLLMRGTVYIALPNPNYT